MDMVNDNKRLQQLKLINYLRYAMIGMMVLVFLSWLLPYFTYDEADYGLHKGYKATKCLWGALLLPSDFGQIKKVMDIKFISLRQLHVVLVMAVVGIIGIIACANKRGIGTTFLPLIFSIYGLIGYFTSDFMTVYCNHPVSRLIQIILIAITFVVCVISFVMCIMEIKSRPADYYLSAVGE
jgi:hypothetical protein